jgi:hypothetical protein
MTAPTIDDYKLQLVELHTLQSTDQELLEWLEAHGITISRSTLTRKLREWNLKRKTTIPLTPALEARIDELFRHSTKSDSQIAKAIKDEDGLSVTANQIKEVRLRQRNLRRLNSSVEQNAHRVQTQHALETLVLHGSGRRFGREWCRVHLRRKYGVRARQVDIESGLRSVNVLPHLHQQPGLRKQRLDNLIVAGPNQLWCMDGHDKLADYGFQIYAAVDAYSRKILWIYCGNANRSKRCVLQQFLQAITDHKVCPRYIRTDHGSETLDLSCAQFRLFLEEALKEPGWSDTELEALTARDCYIDGPSTRNVRIEGLWRILGDEVTRSWSELFQQLRIRKLFISNQLADKVVIRFVFMELIRTELVDFMHDRNEKIIRKQKRDYHVSGVPNELYSSPPPPAVQCGFIPDEATILELQEPLRQFGKYFTT